MGFVGSMSQLGACEQKAAEYPPRPCPSDLKNSPDQAWIELWAVLNVDPRTARGVAWSTDIRYQQ